MSERRFEHDHTPVQRVVRRGWSDPLDASFSQRRPDRRWNTQDFPALYCCCSVRVARAVALDIFRVAGLELEDLHPPPSPRRHHGPLVSIARPRRKRGQNGKNTGTRSVRRARTTTVRGVPTRA